MPVLQEAHAPQRDQVKADHTEKGRVELWQKKRRRAAEPGSAKKSELKKVTWPNQKTVVKNTGTVLLCSLLIGACIWIFDGVAYSLIQAILSLFQG